MSNEQLTGSYDVGDLLNRAPATSPRRRQRRVRAPRLTGAGSVVCAVAVAVAGAVVFGAGEDQPQSVSAQQVRASRPAPHPARPTSRPASRGAARPTVAPATPQAKPTPAPRQVAKAIPVPVSAARLGSLAALLRGDQRVADSRSLRSAAAKLDQAATLLAAGSRTTAAGLTQSAFEQLAEAQRSGRWQPSKAESDLLQSFDYRPPAASVRPDRHDD